MDRFSALTAAVREFDRERDWGRFHSPQNLVLAILVEAGELAEHFQWSDETSIEDRLSQPETLQGVREEMSDVLIHLLQLADRLGIDPLEAAFDKLGRNAQRYPVEASYGDPRKRGHDQDEQPGS